MEYPHTRRDDVVENLHGHLIADPYRWLEDADSPETIAWVEEQRAFTEARLADLPGRSWFAARVDEILSEPVDHLPGRSGGRHLMVREDGRRDQPLLVGADSWQEVVDGGVVVLDPQHWSEDHTTSFQSAAVSPDGSTLCWVVSEAGSDWTTFHCRDLTSTLTEGGRSWLPGIRTKFSFPAWLPDSRSLLVLDFPVEESGDRAVVESAGDPHLVVRRVDEDAPAVDLTPGGDGAGVMYWPWVGVDVDDSGRPTGTGWVVAAVQVGTARTARLRGWRCTPDAVGRAVLGDPFEIFPADDALREVVGFDGDQLLVRTDDTDERGRIIAVDLTSARSGHVEQREVVPAQEGHLAGSALAGGRLVLVHTIDVEPRVSVWDLAGHRVADLDVPGGQCELSAQDPAVPEVFIGTSDPTRRFHRWRLDTATCTLTELPTAARSASPERAATEIVTERRRATSADGTAVPYWWMRPAGKPGPLPTLVYGYGGFDVPVANSWNPTFQAWLEAGGAVAVVNARGGGEFGRSWYEDGIRDHKQHVFDDHIGVLEDLIRRGDARADQLTIEGRSNGGLMAGAVLTQRPDLLGCALPEVGVLDILRFHRFTSGAAWASDYGDPDDPHDFEVELAYSPLHRVVEGAHYPATLVVTSDHDDRVVPAHSHKFTATLQRAQGGEAPVLTRIDHSTGHGAGRPRASRVAEIADKLAFAAHHTGLVVPT
ncbi:prolyl oligopeptidase family serine peptidase [Acidipropionibacterium timonense]|uniref:prolyl oligopeptidase family serine peptidase n=1 Tax=Acidipropionibacterium timonense TaxID=2161818 RepID=UPI001031F88D|nr:prolyl oligopeptidase family serine peptidase [Acidipropionibacterium timonense]